MANPSAWAVGLVALAFVSLTVLRVLGPYDGDPSLLLAFGEKAPDTLQYGERLLGHVEARSELGHDGKFFFVLGNDPFLLDPEENAAVLDRPLYRSQRILYPMMAGGFGLLPPRGVMWGMVILNLFAMGVGTWGASRLAVDMGASSWWGLAFGLNIGLFSEVAVSGGGVVGFAFGMWALVAFYRGRFGWSAALLAGAVLSREALLLMSWGLAAYLVKDRKPRQALLVGLLPTAAAGSWALYARIRIGWSSGVSEVKEIGVPFGGFIDAVGEWTNDRLDLVAGLAIVILFVLFTRRALSFPSPIGWATIGFVPLALLFTVQVWTSYFDITRAVAPTITGFVFLAFVEAGRRRGASPGDRRDPD